MSKPKILIVEDEIIIAEYLAKMVDTIGYEVTGKLTSGEKAISAAAELKPDLVLMDIRLNGAMDGIEAARQITADWNIPIIFLSAFADQGLMDRAKLIRPCGFLVKPIHQRSLKANIELALYTAEIDRQRKASEKKAEESETRWRSLVENSPDHIVDLDLELKIRFVNRPSPGLTREALIGRPLYELAGGGEKQAEVKAILEKVLATGIPAVYETEYLTPDGGTIYYESRVEAKIQPDSREITGVIVSARDLTRSKLIEKSLRERESWLHSTFQQAAVGIIHSDLEGRILRINDRYCQMMGFASEELLGRNYDEITHPDFRKVQSDERNRVIDGRCKTVSIEKQNIRRDGTQVWINLTLSLVRDVNGRIDYLMGIVEDITQRKTFEKALRASEKKYRDLVDNMPQRLFFKNCQSEYVTVNKKYAADFSQSPEFFPAKNDFDIHPRQRAERYRKEDQQIIQSGKPLEYQDERTVKGRIRTLHSLKVPIIMENGETEGILGISWDITDRIVAEREQKRLEAMLQQTQKMEAIGTLAGGIAHDFNNLLHPIIGFSRLGMRAADETGDTYHQFSSIHKAANRAKELVQQILTFSHQSIKILKPVLLQPIVKEALQMLRSRLPTTIQIETEISPACGPVEADVTQIHQIVMNLATNAYHAMQETGGTLQIALQPVHCDAESLPKIGMKPGDYVCLSIRDSGEGISPEIRDRIFEPYFTTKDINKGTGLGLSVVRGIVKSHNSHIMLKSAPGEGTEFTIYFPASLSQPATLVSGSKQLKIRGNERILVVDDEEEIAFFLKEALKQLGYTVTIKSDSREALELFQMEPSAFDMVVTDMTMPHMTGYQLSLELFKIRPEIPVILCTGYSETIDEEKALAVGIKRFLMKPIDQDDLAAAIRDVLDNG
ncbi:PAS domain S-box protein [bacterium]|nr:PAS domain S-box protein [bacterium]